MSEGSNEDRSGAGDPPGTTATDAGAGAGDGETRFVLGDGGQILPDRPLGDGGDPEDEEIEVGGAKRVVAERSVDDVFAEFEEDTPEEVMAADEAEPGPEEIVVEGDVENLLGDLSEVEPEPTDEPGRSIDRGGVGGLLTPADERLFEEIDDNARRVVADSDVESVFERFEEDTPEEVIDAEAGERVPDPVAEPDADGDSDISFEPLESGRVGAFVDESDRFESVAGEFHRIVGEADPDAVFERFEEDTPEEVAAAADASPESDARVPPAGEGQDSFDDRTWDLSGVDLEPADAEADAGASRTGDAWPAPEPEETERAVASLLADLSGAEPGQDEDITGLLGDLSEVDVGDAPGPAAPTDAEAETLPTVLDPEELGDTAFEWLGEDQPLLERTGEDTHRAVGESDVDAVFESFEEATPEEVMAGAAGVSATAMYDDHATGQPAGRARGAASPPTVEGWASSGASAAGVSATAMYDELAPDAAAGHDSPTVFRPGVDSGEDGIDLGEVGVNRDGTVVGEADPDAVFERIEEDSPEEVMAADDASPESDPLVPPAGEGQREFDEQVWDLSGVGLEAEEPEPDRPTGDRADRTGDQAVEGLLGDLSDVDLEGDATSDASEGEIDDPATFVDPADGDDTGDVHEVVGESDVDAFFERFEEDTPEEVAEPDRPKPGRSPEPSSETPTANESKDLSEGLDFDSLGVDEALDDFDESPSETGSTPETPDQPGASGAGSQEATGARGEQAAARTNGIVDDASKEPGPGPATSASERVSEALSSDDGDGDAPSESGPLFPDAVQRHRDDDAEASRLDAAKAAVSKLSARIRDLF